MDQQRNERVEQRRAAQAQRRAAQQAKQRAVQQERRAAQDQLRAERAQLREQRQERLRRAQEQQRFGLIAGLVIVVLAVAGLLIYLNRPRSPGDDLAIVASPIPASVESTGRRLGSATAPVTIIEYGDYQCPECGAFARDEAAGMIDEFVATGQASFEYRDLPVLGEASVGAAEAATCADDQGAFWPFHRTVFANQDGDDPGALDPERLAAMAEALELEMAAFTACVENRTHAATVTAMAEEARGLGVEAPPTFLINDQAVVYTRYDDLRTAILAALDE
jgi:protein-disulfide isomerase